MLRQRCLTAIGLLLLASCGGVLQGPPNFQEAFGAVDEPCAASNASVAHCTAHVVLVNNGGEGVGYITIAVPLKDSTDVASSARTATSATCSQAVPDTPAGGAVDLACNFELPMHMTVANYPFVRNVAFSGATNATSSGSISGVASVGLALVAALLALITLMASVTGRRRSVGPLVRQAPEPDEPAEQEDDSW
jgi:hypothetical protein